MGEFIGLIIVFYLVGIILIGWMIGLAGETIFDFDGYGGTFLWPLMLCVLIIYGIYALIRAVVRKFRIEIKEFDLTEQQIKGISFLCNEGNGIPAYDVGVGKTVVGAAATVNQIQTGRAQKPLLMVPKAVYKKGNKGYYLWKVKP
jgi:hypothetical protein